jgi:hypothetical protein
MIESRIMCHRSGKKLEIGVAGQSTEARRRESGDRDPSEIGFSVQNDQNLGDRGIIPVGTVAVAAHKVSSEEVTKCPDQYR